MGLIMYLALENFDDGEKRYQKGDEYKGPFAERLKGEGLLVKIEETPPKSKPVEKKPESKKAEQPKKGK